MTATFGARAVHHVGITVPDLDAAVAFFRLLLETEPLGIEHHDRVRFLEQITGYEDLALRVAFFEAPGNGVLLELIEYLRPAGRPQDPETYNIGNSHVSFHVTDIDAEFDRLSAAGVAFRSERPVEVPSGPYAGARFAYLRSPWGLTVELCQMPAAGGAATG